MEYKDFTELIRKKDAIIRMIDTLFSFSETDQYFDLVLPTDESYDWDFFLQFEKAHKTEVSQLINSIREFLSIMEMPKGKKTQYFVEIKEFILRKRIELEEMKEPIYDPYSEAEYYHIKSAAETEYYSILSNELKIFVDYIKYIINPEDLLDSEEPSDGDGTKLTARQFMLLVRFLEDSKILCLNKNASETMIIKDKITLFEAITDYKFHTLNGFTKGERNRKLNYFFSIPNNLGEIVPSDIKDYKAIRPLLISIPNEDLQSKIAAFDIKIK